MKTTLRQLETRCRDLNHSLRVTPWGVAVERRGLHDVAVVMTPRKPGHVRQVSFVGTTREASAFLDGLIVGVSLRISYTDGENTQDGSDA